MKKFYLLVFLVLLMGTSLHAKQIDVNEAKTIAAQYLQQQSATRAAGGDLRLAYTATDNSGTTRSGAATNLLYVFERGNSNGFIIVAGDDRMRPVLGYTTSGSFDLNTPNEGFQWWLSTITATAKAVANGSESDASTSTRTTLKSSVEPLVKTKWNQYAPYYNLCPYDDVHKSQSLTGCVATAMAQVLYYCYSDTTQTLSGTGRYTSADNSDTYTDVDLSQFTIDYTKMELTYDGDESDEAKEAVATLMYACGLAVGMEYCSEGSSSNIANYQLVKYFGIDSGCKLAVRSQYTSDGWDELVRGELDYGRPLLYEGQGADGGHEFVCDGYNSDGLYHINWGWGGYGDGYFDFYSIDFEFVDSQRVICGIKPGKGVANYSDMLTYATLTANGTLPLENVKTLNCKISRLASSGDTFIGIVGLALCKGDGTTVSTGDLREVTVRKGYNYYPTLSITFPNNIADGTYYLRIVAGESPSDIHIVKGDGVYGYLTVTVKDGKVTVNGYHTETAQLSLESFSIDDGVGYANVASSISLVVKNSGKDEFYGYIRCDNASTVKAAIKSGESKTVKTNIKPDSAGTQQSFHFWAVDEYSGDSIAIGNVVFDVLEESEHDALLTVDSVYVPKADVARGDSMLVAVRLHNDGGKFDGYIKSSYNAKVYSSDNFIWTWTGESEAPSLILARGDSATVYIPINYLSIEKEYGFTIDHGTFTIKNICAYFTLNNQACKKVLVSFDGGDAPTINLKQQESGIEEVMASDGLDVSVSGNTIVVKGTTGSDVIRVYNVGGSLVKEVKASSGNTVIYGMQSGQSYIVSVKGHNVKVAL